MNFDASYMLNVYSLFLLIIILATIIYKREDFKYSSRLLKIIIVSTCAILIVEILSWAFNEIDAQYAYYLNYFFNALFFIMGTMVVALFASYIDYMNFRSRLRLKKRFYYMPIAGIAIVLVIINFFTPVIFSIDSANVYSREPYINIGFGSVYLLVLYMLIITFKNRKILEKEVFYSIFVFSTIPIIAAVLQMLFYGLLIMWSFVGLALVIAYIYTETISNSKDYLTKLYTRLITNEYIERLLERNETFTMILIDLDDFKDINDTYGHKVGDRVLIDFANILKDTFIENAIISRIGGDEFLVIISGDTHLEIKNILTELNYKTEKHNHLTKLAEIKFSAGYTIRSKDSYDTVDELFIRCDKLMYKEKASHKELDTKDFNSKYSA